MKGVGCGNFIGDKSNMIKITLQTSLRSKKHISGGKNGARRDGAHLYSEHSRDRSGWISEFEASEVYRGSSIHSGLNRKILFQKQKKQTNQSKTKQKNMNGKFKEYGYFLNNRMGQYC